MDCRNIARRYRVMLPGPEVSTSRGIDRMARAGEAVSMRLRSIILAFAGCMLSWAAQSQPIQGFYIGGGAGLLMPFATKATSFEPGVSGAIDLRQALDFDTQLSFGYALGDGWRFELEGDFGRASIRAVSGTTFPATSAGTMRNGGFMVNALFDLDVRSRYVYPYLGVGLGYQVTRLDGFVDTRANGPGAFSAGGAGGGVAAQAIGGLSFPIPNMPGLSLTADYRIMDITGGDWVHGTSTIGLAPGSPPVAGSLKLHNQFDQTVMFGMRYAFNTPPPPGVAAAAAAENTSRSYQVALDPNQTTLTDRAQVVVRRAALASTRQGTTRIVVPDGAANTVVAALVADGVPREAISLQATGQPPSGEQWIEIVTR